MASASASGGAASASGAPSGGAAGGSGASGEAVCPVCLDKPNRVDRKPVVCPLACAPGPDGAKPWACRVCYTRGILSTPGHPSCLFCRMPWTDDFIDETFTAAFRTGAYRAHRAAMLREAQTALLPALQPAAAARREAEAMQREIDAAAAAVEAAERRYHDLLYRRSQLQMQGLGMGVGAQARAQAQGEGGGAGGAGEKRAFVKKCTVDGCEGFLTTAYKCGMCATWVCPTCHAVKGADRDAPHTCNADEAASVAAIRAHSKPCPKCGVPTEKSFGCSQMWCVACQTAWDWNTGRIETGRIHNPEYLEWLTRTGRRPEAAQVQACGGGDAGLPDAWRVDNTIGGHVPVTTRTPLLNALRLATHIQLHELRAAGLAPRPANPLDVFRELNIRKLLGEFADEGAWAKALEKRDREYTKREEVRDRLQTFVLGTTDIFNGLLAAAAAAGVPTARPVYYGGRVAAVPQTAVYNPAVAAAARDALTQVGQLREIVNESLRRLGKRKGCAVRTIKADWSGLENEEALAKAARAETKAARAETKAARAESKAAGAEAEGKGKGRGRARAGV